MALKNSQAIRTHTGPYAGKSLLASREGCLCWVSPVPPGQRAASHSRTACPAPSMEDKRKEITPPRDPPPKNPRVGTAQVLRQRNFL